MALLRLIGLTTLVAGIIGCATADHNDPIYNTKQMLIHDSRHGE